MSSTIHLMPLGVTHPLVSPHVSSYQTNPLVTPLERLERRKTQTKNKTQMLQCFFLGWNIPKFEMSASYENHVIPCASVLSNTEPNYNPFKESLSLIFTPNANFGSRRFLFLFLHCIISMTTMKQKQLRRRVIGAQSLIRSLKPELSPRARRSMLYQITEA